MPEHSIRERLTANEVDVLEHWGCLDVYDARYSKKGPTWSSCVRQLCELPWQLWPLALGALALGPLGIHLVMMRYRREVVKAARRRALHLRLDRPYTPKMEAEG